MEVDVDPWLSVPEPDPAADLLAAPPAGLGACGPMSSALRLAKVQLQQREYDHLNNSYGCCLNSLCCTVQAQQSHTGRCNCFFRACACFAGSPTMQALAAGSSLQQRPAPAAALPQQHQQQRQQSAPGLPTWQGAVNQPLRAQPPQQQPHPQQLQPPQQQQPPYQQQAQPQQLPPQHIWQLPPGGLHLQQQQQQQLQPTSMPPALQQQQLAGQIPSLSPQQQQQLQLQRMQQQQQQQQIQMQLAQRQLQQLPPQMRAQLLQQQQQHMMMMMQARKSDSQCGTGSNPPSAPGSPRAGHLSRQNSMQQLDRQVSTSSAGGTARLDASALLAAAAPKPRKKQQGGSGQAREGGGGGSKKAAAAAAAAAAAYTALWKHTGPPREPRIAREAGVDYEEVGWLTGV